MKIFLRPTYGEFFEGIEISDILMLEANNNYTIIHKSNCVTKVCITLKTVFNFIKSLDKDDCFIRISRMSVINKNYVTAINGNSLMVGNKWQTISREERKYILRMFKVLRSE